MKIEIFLLIPLLFIFYTINEVSCLMLIKYIDPTIILIYRYFYYFLLRIITYIINEADEQYITLILFILYEIEQLASVISGLIYIELLELKFLGLDYELKKNIDRRGNEDTIAGLDIMGDESESNDTDSSKTENMEEIRELPTENK